jgi:hypothetical protein
MKLQINPTSDTIALSYCSRSAGNLAELSSQFWTCEYKLLSFTKADRPGLPLNAGLDIRDNVAYYNYDSSSIVLLSGTQNTIAHNLALGTTKFLKAGHDMDQPASYEIWASGNIVSDNVAAGSERFGFRVIADGCNQAAGFVRNSAHTNLIGLYLHVGSDGGSVRNCTAVKSFQASRVRLRCRLGVWIRML